MPMRATMKMTDIPGESKFDGHEEEIDIFSADWGASQMADMQIGSGLSVSSAMVAPLTVSKNLDCASPYLAKAALTAKHIAEVIVTYFKDSGDEHLDYLTFTLKDAVVSNYSVSGAGEGPITEAVVLCFSEMTMLYKMQGTDHSAGNEHEFTYTLASGKAS